MKQVTRSSIWVTALIVIALVLDQVLKLYVRTHFMLGESHSILPFFQLCFVENDGMAFGIEWFNKIFLTLFRVVAIGLLGWYLYVLIRRQDTRSGYLTTVALVTAGAAGNVIDCIFYGRLFGYAGWFQGKVVDMLYFPLITSSTGECLFFRPVFNLADSCITVAVFVILIWYRKDLDASLNSRS